MQIQISWLLSEAKSRSVGFFQKPTDLDLQFCKGRVYPGSAGQGLICHLLIIDYSKVKVTILLPSFWLMLFFDYFEHLK